LQSAEKGDILNLHVTALPRQQVFDTVILGGCPFHDGQ